MDTSFFKEVNPVFIKQITSVTLKKERKNQNGWIRMDTSWQCAAVQSSVLVD